MRFEKMLLRAKHFNKANNITGFIIYYKEQFIQLIEGEKNVIQPLYKNIKADKRHYHVQTILTTSSKQSLWTDWSMAFYDFSDQSDENNYLRLLLESNFENANKKEKSSEVLLTLRQETSFLLDN